MFGRKKDAMFMASFFGYKFELICVKFRLQLYTLKCITLWL